MIIRTIIYDGPADKLDKQLALSLQDGVRTFGDVTIGVITLPTPSTFSRYLRSVWRLRKQVKNAK